jgi:Secretion system C-terminal sorting domain/PKD-like domain
MYRIVNSFSETKRKPKSFDRVGACLIIISIFMKELLMKTSMRGPVMCFVALMVMALFSGVKAQLTVQVPVACSVAVAGVGGTTGFGGFVGDGGVVTMPDPFDDPSASGDFTASFTSPPPGYAFNTWRVYGDLSFQTSSTQMIAPTVPGNLVQNIESFNMFARPSESTFPSSSNLARSKGRVQLSYVVINPKFPCTTNVNISFEVYKQYSNTTYLPPIIGPSCWTPNTVVTYSVDPIASDNLLTTMIGTDTYYWSVVDGSGNPVANFYGSADNSSITFTTPNVLNGVYTVRCGYGLANPWVASPTFGNRTTIVTKSVNAPVPTPTFSVAGPLPSCLNTGVTSFSATLNVVGGMSYAWSYAGSGAPTVTASGLFNETVTVTGMDNNPGILTLTVTNTAGFCPAVQTFQYPINRNFVAPMAITLPPNTTCIAPGSTFQLSLPANAMNNPTTWNLGGWSYVPNNAMASTITVTVPANASGGSNIMTASSTACPSGTISATVSVAPTPVVSGPTCINFGSTAPLTYTVTAIGGPNTYSWTVPAGWAILGPPNPNSNTVTVKPNGTTVGNVTATVCIGACCASTFLAVNFNPVAPTIVGPPCFNVDMPGGATFSVLNPLPGTYTWGIDAAFGTIVGPSTGTAITVNTYGTQGPYPMAVTVTYTNACGTSTVSSFPANLFPNGTLNLTSNPGMDILSVTGFSSPGNFKWVQDCGLITESICIGCGTAPTAVFTNPGNGGSWGVIVPDFQGCFTRMCTTTTYGNRLAQNADNDAEGNDALTTEVTLSPNPNGGEFDIRVEKVKTSADFVVFDALGQQVANGTLKAGTNRFNQSKLASGIYFVHITVDGKTTLKRMEIRH